VRTLAVGTIMVDIMAVGLGAVAKPGEVVYTPVDARIGGHPIDVAIDLVDLGRSPDSVAVAAAVGRGLFGSFVRDAITPYGFQTYLQDVEEEDTGRNIVLEVTGEDRRFHLDPGANRWLRSDHVIAAIDAWRPDLLTVRPGYSGIDLDLEEILAPLTDTIVMLDLMKPHPDRPADYLTPALRLADIVHCNEREALINTGTNTLEDAVKVFLDAGVKLVLVTSGEKGAHAFSNGRQVTQARFRVDTVDATGCGDAFCAGVVDYLQEQPAPNLDGLGPEELTELLMRAQAVGASAATAIGCVGGVSGTKVASLLAEQGNSVREQTIEREGP
jgi:sugar/nucleoside kinase (ribokinase family)